MCFPDAIEESYHAMHPYIMAWCKSGSFAGRLYREDGGLLGGGMTCQSLTELVVGCTYDFVFACVYDCMHVCFLKTRHIIILEISATLVHRNKVRTSYLVLHICCNIQVGRLVKCIHGSEIGRPMSGYHGKVEEHSKSISASSINP